MKINLKASQIQFIIRLLVNLLVTGWLQSVVPPAGAAETIRIAFEDREQFPYYLGEGERIDWVRPGISVEIVRKAAEDIGLQASFVRQPWKRCLISLRDGQVDAIFNASFVRDRLDYGVYPGAARIPDPIFRTATISYSLYRQKGSGVSWNGRNFTGMTGAVGVVLGYSIVEDLEKMGVTVEEVGSSRQNFIKLAIGRLSGAVLQTVTGDQLLKSGAFPTLERVEPPIATKDYYLIMSKSYIREHPEPAAKLWQKIAELRDSMTNQSMDKYAK